MSEASRSNAALIPYLQRLVALSGNPVEQGLVRLQHYLRARHWLTVRCPLIAITGTNGKGSVAALLDASYQAAGYQTARFTSPHLLRFNERLRVQGQAIDDARLMLAFAELLPVCERLALNYFQSVFLILFSIVQGLQDCQVLIFEVGVGGRKDPLSLLGPDLVIITNVALDHQMLLGADREAIGREKAGLFKTKIPAVYGAINPPASVVAASKMLKVPLAQRGQAFDFAEQPDSWSWWSGKQRLVNLPKPRLRIDNAAIALQAISALQLCLPVSESAVRQGLQQVRLSGRLDYYPGQVSYLLDVAHNAQALAALSAYVAALPSSTRCRCVLGMYADKVQAAALATLIPWVDEWYLIDLQRKVEVLGPPAQATEEGRTVLGNGASRAVDEMTTSVVAACLQRLGVESVRCQVFATPTAALLAAQAQAKPGELVVVTGSFQTVAAAISDRGCQLLPAKFRIQGDFQI